MGIGVSPGSVKQAPSERFQAYIIATTSAGAGIIVMTSGAFSIFVTDLLVSVDGPMDVSLCSETTVFAKVYLATKGGFAMNNIVPYACFTNDSFRVICSSSGACAVSAVGFVEVTV